MGYSFPTMYGTTDRYQIIIESIVSYFNELGDKLIDARESGKKIRRYDINPMAVNNMRHLGITSTLLDTGFTGGVEHRICRTLLGTGHDIKVEYHWYFDAIYKILCQEIEGGWEYSSCDDILLNRAAAIKKMIDISKIG